MRYIICLALSIASLCSQPTISPTTVTVAPGSSQFFTTNATDPLWRIIGSFAQGMSIIGDTCATSAAGEKCAVFTAPRILAAGTNSLSVEVWVYDRDNGYKSAYADVKVIPVVPVSPCSCPGDVFVVSSTPATSIIFTKQNASAWTAILNSSTQVAGSWVALVQIYRSGVPVKESDIVSLTSDGSKLTLITKDAWSTGSTSEIVTGKWVMLNK